MTKICGKCGKEKPATTEYFEKVKGCKDGLRGQCKECRREYRKQHYKKHQEEMKEYANQYYKKNKEYYNQHSKEYREENKEKTKEYNKQYRKEHKEYFKQWRGENIDRRRQYEQKRRVLKKGLPATLMLDQWQRIKNDFNNKCAYCGMAEDEHIKRFGQVLHQEHFIPLSKGGEYTHNNIIPACKSCNHSKHNTDFFKWYPTYKRYNEEREQFILEYLGYIEDSQQLALDREVI